MFDTEELESFYRGYPADVSDIERELDETSSRHPEWSPLRRKAMVYEVMARRCPVKLFRTFPFYVEMTTGRARHDLGAGGIGAWMKGRDPGKRLTEEGTAWYQPLERAGLSLGWPVLDDNHHCAGIDNALRWGCAGLIARSRERLARTSREEEREFLLAGIRGNRARIHIARRFAAEAERLLRGERESATRERLERIAATARRVPEEPPRTFYEALNTILFMREITEELEGNGISILGHLDRILDPFYRADLASGRSTPYEARALLGSFLAWNDVRFGMREARGHVGTNTTVMIGGCDAAGCVVFNDVTRMILELYEELRLVDPKLNARVSSRHPEEYLGLLARLQASGSNSLCLFNDDVLIPANVAMGKAVEDCRLYVGGGCQENVLENTEVSSRATIYLNVAQVLLMGFHPERWSFFEKRDGVRLAPLAGCETFDALYRAFLDNLRSVVVAHVEQRNRGELAARLYNPCPLHSTTIDDCIERARDMLEGGARYSSGSVSLTGAGTLVDSLHAVRRVVFEEKRITLAALVETIDRDWSGAEVLRQYVLHRLGKYGQDDGDVRLFSAGVFSDLARASSGMPNARGGRYEASLFSFRTFTTLGERTGATPDGRRAGEHLSPGMSPSLLALGRTSGVAQILSSLEPLRLTEYPVVAVLDLKLPVSGARTDLIVPVIRRFLGAGGSVLQLNCVDQATLRDARAHPERHPDLVVRVSGYSAYFATLPPAVQEEIIERTVVSLGRGPAR